MKRLILMLIVILTSSNITFSQNEAITKDGKKVLLYDNGTWVYAGSDTNPSLLDHLEIPKTHPKETITYHHAYTLSYNEDHEQANWVAYELTKEETNKTFDRTNKFLIDPDIKTGSANDKDYAGSGYDRGHLAPAADMGWSATSMTESFYFSNMSPQVHSFNGGIWKELEELVRTWAVENESIYIVTGPILSEGLPTIGENKVSVPKYFYKVILDYKEPHIKGIGFVIPNSESFEPLQTFAVTIDQVETVSNIDFFPTLPDQQENTIEKSLDLNAWTWKNIKKPNKKEQSTATTVQCKGKTQSGDRCKNKTKNSSGYCHLHS